MGKPTHDKVQWTKLLDNKKHIKIKSTEGLISVKIDSRTTVLVKPGTDIEALKLKYLNYKTSNYETNR
jgi:hypothetical protein